MYSLEHVPKAGGYAWRLLSTLNSTVTQGHRPSVEFEYAKCDICNLQRVAVSRWVLATLLVVIARQPGPGLCPGLSDFGHGHPMAIWPDHPFLGRRLLRAVPFMLLLRFATDYRDPCNTKSTVICSNHKTDWWPSANFELGTGRRSSSRIVNAVI